MNQVMAGAVGGIAGTVPMSAAMEVLHAWLGPTARRPLPPRRIEEHLSGALGVREELGEAEHVALTMLLHFGFGGFAGALYGVAAPRLPGPPAAKGAAYGVAVWAAGYLGGMPAFRLERSAAREPAARNALMIAAHVVWGVVLGEVADRLRTVDTTRTTRRQAREWAMAAVPRSRPRLLSLVRRART